MLFDRICRDHGITHLLTGVRRPTTTGKIERFHKTLRAELLTGRRFDSLAEAQQAMDTWVDDYNIHRPHQALAMVDPAQRFQPAPHQPQPDTSTTAPVRSTRDPQSDRGHPQGVGQRPHRGLLPAGLTGRHLAGQVVTVQLHPTVLQVYFAGQLIRTVPRHTTKEVIQLRAHRPHRPKQPTTN